MNANINLKTIEIQDLASVNEAEKVFRFDTDYKNKTRFLQMRESIDQFLDSHKTGNASTELTVNLLGSSPSIERYVSAAILLTLAKQKGIVINGDAVKQAAIALKNDNCIKELNMAMQDLGDVPHRVIWNMSATALEKAESQLTKAEISHAELYISNQEAAANGGFVQTRTKNGTLRKRKLSRINTDAHVKMTVSASKKIAIPQAQATQIDLSPIVSAVNGQQQAVQTAKIPVAEPKADQKTTVRQPQVTPDTINAGNDTVEPEKTATPIEITTKVTPETIEEQSPPSPTPSGIKPETSDAAPQTNAAKLTGRAVPDLLKNPPAPAEPAPIEETPVQVVTPKADVKKGPSEEEALIKPRATPVDGQPKTTTSSKPKIDEPEIDNRPLVERIIDAERELKHEAELKAKAAEQAQRTRTILASAQTQAAKPRKSGLKPISKDFYKEACEAAKRKREAANARGPLRLLRYKQPEQGLKHRLAVTTAAGKKVVGTAARYGSVAAATFIACYWSLNTMDTQAFAAPVSASLVNQINAYSVTMAHSLSAAGATMAMGLTLAQQMVAKWRKTPSRLIARAKGATLTHCITDRADGRPEYHAPLSFDELSNAKQLLIGLRTHSKGGKILGDVLNSHSAKISSGTLNRMMTLGMIAFTPSSDHDPAKTMIELHPQLWGNKDQKATPNNFLVIHQLMHELHIEFADKRMGLRNERCDRFLRNVLANPKQQILPCGIEEQVAHSMMKETGHGFSDYIQFFGYKANNKPVAFDNKAYASLNKIAKKAKRAHKTAGRRPLPFIA